MTTVYFDVCCLNRPFDDQEEDRIHLEAEAVLLIMKHIQAREWTWISSEVVNYEIQQTPNAERRTEVQLLTDHADSEVMLNESLIQRGETFSKMGLKTYDALHLACAESVQAAVFLTTDDKILKKSRQRPSMTTIPVRNPLEWLWERVKP